ncbi:MAG: helix-turn-helix domain-containing protein [Opitutaceae bacterium]
MANKDSKPQPKATGTEPIRLHTPNPENAVTRARLKLSLTQEDFAKLLDTPIGTVRGWEQGRRKPPPCAKLLMRVAMEYPEHVLECASDAPSLPKKPAAVEVVQSEPEEGVGYHPGGDSEFWLL